MNVKACLQVFLISIMLSKKRITLSCRQTLRVVDPGTILYCKSQDYCTLIYLYDGSSFVVGKSLSKLADEISDLGFLRVSQSFLVNFSQVDHFDKLERLVKLKNGAMIPFTLKIKDLLELIEAMGYKWKNGAPVDEVALRANQNPVPNHTNPVEYPTDSE